MNGSGEASERFRVTRRSVLGVLGGLGAGAGTGWFVGPGPAEAQPQAGATQGHPETVDQALQRLFGARPIRDGRALIKLDVPLIAENGAAVPVSVEVSSPMTLANHVKRIYIVADKNRFPVAVRAVLTPEAGQALVGTNIRLGETGDVRAIAEQSDGTLLQVKREVRVTVSGCG
jgi:sulfur-oxidizing protein SoxY